MVLPLPTEVYISPETRDFGSGLDEILQDSILTKVWGLFSFLLAMNKQIDYSIPISVLHN